MPLLIFGGQRSHESQILVHHARCSSIPSHASKSDPGSADSMDTRALSETLKLVFNLIQFYPNRSLSFRILLHPILSLLQALQITSDPLQAPLIYVINVLLNIELEPANDDSHVDANEIQEDILFPAERPNLHTDRLVEILSGAVESYEDDALESKAIPLVTLIRRVVEIAPEGARKLLASSLLPSDTERDQPLGTSASLASKLLRLSSTPAAPQVREGLSSLLFELSDKDPSTFVRNVGYGYASGYLMSHKIPVPAASLGEDVGAKVTNVDGLEINPTTGQRRDKEPPDMGTEMTEEEKEREAERLFVLFERLKSTGVMNVVNPVEKAAREGRLEEVEDDDSE